MLQAPKRQIPPCNFAGITKKEISHRQFYLFLASMNWPNRRRPFHTQLYQPQRDWLPKVKSYATANALLAGISWSLLLAVCKPMPRNSMNKPNKAIKGVSVFVSAFVFWVFFSSCLPKLGTLP